MLRKYNKRSISPVSPTRTNHTYYGTALGAMIFNSGEARLRLKAMCAAQMDFCILLNSSEVPTGKLESSSVA